MATESELHARSVLEEEGFNVKPIPRGDTRTAGFLVHDASSSYLVEVTSKDESEFSRALLDRAREKGMADGTRRLGPANRLDAIVCDKAKQLAGTPIEADFHVLWIAAFHGDWAFLADALRRTLYGMTSAMVFSGDRAIPVQRECLSYHYFSFYKARSLHAVMLSTRNGRRIYVNAMSLRASTFRESILYNRFTDKSRLDPSQAPDNTLVVAAEVDRSRPKAQWEYLRDRYGPLTSEVAMCDWRGVLVVPSQETPEEHDNG